MVELSGQSGRDLCCIAIHIDHVCGSLTTGLSGANVDTRCSKKGTLPETRRGIANDAARKILIEEANKIGSKLGLKEAIRFLKKHES